MRARAHLRACEPAYLPACEGPGAFFVSDLRSTEIGANEVADKFVPRRPTNHEPARQRRDGRALTQ